MSDKKALKSDGKEPEKALKPADTPAKGKVIKVKFLRTHPAFAISIGEETEITQDDFDKYSEHGPFFERVHTR